VKFWPDERVPSGKKHCDGIPNIDSDYFVEGDLRSRRIKRKSGHEEVLGWLVGWLVGWLAFQACWPMRLCVYSKRYCRILQ
jgi:hypothetical protein